MKTLACILILATLLATLPSPTEASISVSAIQDARDDAAADINKKLWFMMGCGGGVFPFVMLTPLALGGLSYIRSTPLDTYVIFVFGVGLLLPTGYAALDSPVPPADRFLGKTSDYIDAYTAAYRNQIKRMRVVQSAKGCLLGTCLSGGSLIVTTIIMLNNSGGDTPD